jgi:hypothetical protein
MRGSTQFAVRWNTLRCAARSASGGTSCEAVEPVPITPRRRPAASKPSSQRAECSTRPPNDSMPSIAGSRGRDSGPVLHTKWRAAYDPRSVSTRQRFEASSKVARRKRSPSRRCGRTPSRVATSSM